MRRRVRPYEAVGDASVMHGLRGGLRTAGWRESSERKALARAETPLYSDFDPTLLSEHLERDPEIGFVHPKRSCSSR
jgi:hypothetical protein